MLSVLCFGDIVAQTYAYGGYQGTGSAKSITGLGFQPECIIIKAGNGAYEGIIRTADMDAGEAKGMGTTATACSSGNITSLDANGFTVGTGNSANHSGTFYHYIAFNESTNIHVGTYTGDGKANAETVAGCGFQPEAFICWGDEADQDGDVSVILNAMCGAVQDGFYTYDGNSAQNHWSAWTAGGWTTDTWSDSPINSGVKYYYIAFNESGTTIKENSYTANNGASDLSVTDIGFQTDFVIVYSYVNRQLPVFRTAHDATDKTQRFTAASGVAGEIKAITATGFTAGAGNVRVDQANQANHHYLAMSGGTALPVELTSFSVDRDGNNAEISWQTAVEKNSDHFEILHSTDGENFELIGTIAAQGNTSTLTEYYFTHENISTGIHYYQLIEYDIDGKFEKFKIISLNQTSAIDIITQLFPNPASSNVNLYFNSFTGGIYKLNIYNTNGQSVYSAQIPGMIGENKFMVQLYSYPNGQYIISVTDPNGTASTIPFMKHD